MENQGETGLSVINGRTMRAFFEKYWSVYRFSYRTLEDFRRFKNYGENGVERWNLTLILAPLLKP